MRTLTVTTESLMLTKITTPITFFEVFQAMRAQSTMEVGQGRDQEEIAGHRRHGEMLFETPGSQALTTKRRGLKASPRWPPAYRDETTANGTRRRTKLKRGGDCVDRGFESANLQIATLMPGGFEEKTTDR